MNTYKVNPELAKLSPIERYDKVNNEEFMTEFEKCISSLEYFYVNYLEMNGFTREQKLEVIKTELWQNTVFTLSNPDSKIWQAGKTRKFLDTV